MWENVRTFPLLSCLGKADKALTVEGRFFKEKSPFREKWKLHSIH